MTEVNSVEQVKIAPLPVVEVVLVIVVMLVLGTLLGTIFYISIDHGLALIINELIMLIVPLVYFLSKGVDIKRYIGLDVNPNLVLWGFVSALILLSVDIAVSFVLFIVFGESEAVVQSNTIITELTESPWGLISVATALGLAGVCEEFAFRGFLQSTLTRRFSFMPALITTAFVFGLFHFDPQLVYIISAMTAGIVLGYIYHHWNSYIVAVIAHSTVNLTVLVMLLIGV